MNCSLIFRGQLNYPFQLIFSFAGCASYGSFNVSSVCVLITRCKRIYNSPRKMHIQHHVCKCKTGTLSFSVSIIYSKMCKIQIKSLMFYNRQKMKYLNRPFLYLRHHLLLNLVNYLLGINCIVFILIHSW